MTLPVVLDWAVQTAIAFISTIAFAIIFHSPKNQYIFAGFTGAFGWLIRHCTEYGFILRYPEDKTDITGIIYEPWHFRFVGQAAAEEMTRDGLCLEEYLGQVNSSSEN